MAKKSLSFVADGTGGFELREFPVPEIGDDGLIMQVEMCGICGGGDPIIFSGRHPHAKYPLVMGHEMIGRVAAIGKNAAEERGLKEGDRFVVEVMIPCGRCPECRSGNYQLCVKEEQYGVSRPADDGIGIWGGYGNYLFIDPRSITHKVDGSVPVERAVTIAVLANAGRWCRLANLTTAEWVVIQGPGPQGICGTAVAKTMGANVIIMGISKDKQRLELAKELGADHTVVVDEEDPVTRVQEITEGRMADVVLECSGAVQAVEPGLNMLKRRGRYVLSGYSSKKPVEITKDLIPLKELHVIGGWGQAYGFEAGCQIIADGEYALERMVTDRFTLETAAEGIKKAESGEVGIKAVLEPPPLP
jgi:2-desacetyl-2-hydroxyethyl bacteriochlorophyllide A dehydrogenase